MTHLLHPEANLRVVVQAKRHWCFLRHHTLHVIENVLDRGLRRGGCEAGEDLEALNELVVHVCVEVGHG